MNTIRMTGRDAITYAQAHGLALSAHTEYFLRAVRNLGAAARQKTLFEGLSL